MRSDPSPGMLCVRVSERVRSTHFQIRDCEHSIFSPGKTPSFTFSTYSSSKDCAESLLVISVKLCSRAGTSARAFESGAVQCARDASWPSAEDQFSGGVVGALADTYIYIDIYIYIHSSSLHHHHAVAKLEIQGVVWSGRHDTE